MTTSSNTTISAEDYASQFRFDGRNILVLGTGGGVGSHVARGLHALGATIGCVDRDPDAAKSAADSVGGFAIECDVTSPTEFEDMLAAAQRDLGPISGIVDVVSGSQMGPLSALDYDTWQRSLAGVTGHAFLAMTRGAAAMSAAGGGSMVFVGSISGISAVAGMTAYGSAKAALHHLVTCMGPELAPAGVRVNAVAPGYMASPSLNAALTAQEWAEIESYIPQGAGAQPSEVASVVLFLMSDLASRITGQVLAVDGGLARVARMPPDLPWTRQGGLSSLRGQDAS